MEPIDFDGDALDGRHFLLLDPLRAEGGVAQSAWQSLPLRALAPPGFGAQKSQLPYLLAWQDLNDGQRSLALRLLTDCDEATAASMCVALLLADVEPVYVRVHLRQLLAPHFPGGGRGVFRFYDPVVFMHLGWMLDAAQQSVLFGPVSAWAFPWNASWFMQKTPSQGSHHVRFAPGAAVWHRIGRIGTLYAVLESEPVWRADPVLYGPQIEPWLVKAETYGLDERDDVVTFTRHGMLIHPKFDTHPKVISMLQHCVGNPTRYRRLTSMWSDADWNAVVRDLDRSAHAKQGAPTNVGHAIQGAS
ncbi:hypothetical protein WT72_23960 [Burkholderia pseudomultivorans]|uniref:DUF4123 domain-containing protein n=1 Tax=Burkholderia pseudomultivorans TaxID=1207504 RepID=UPI00075EE320|nr:DUF4123 domain-containing protein [Burkholderia pseudomultivorans]KWI50237.1 hypothetical protein WT72_23960 [Burkholderia pseudomultivorans]